MFRFLPLAAWITLLVSMHFGAVGNASAAIITRNIVLNASNPSFEAIRDSSFGGTFRSREYFLSGGNFDDFLLNVGDTLVANILFTGGPLTLVDGTSTNDFDEQIDINFGGPLPFPATKSFSTDRTFVFEGVTGSLNQQPHSGPSGGSSGSSAFLTLFAPAVANFTDTSFSMTGITLTQTFSDISFNPVIAQPVLINTFSMFIRDEFNDLVVVPGPGSLLLVLTSLPFLLRTKRTRNTIYTRSASMR